MTIFQKAPGKLPRRRVRPLAIAILCLVALCSLALADDPVFRVARISLIEGEVSYQQANDLGKEWFDATLNLPLKENDQVYAGSDGRAEIQLSGRNLVRIDRDTNLRFTQFNANVIQIALPIGSARFRIDSLDKRRFEVVDANDAGDDDSVYFEVDTPSVAVTFVKEGVYRVDALEDGSTEVIVRQGQAEVYNQEIGTVVVKSGRRIIIEGSDDLYRITGLKDEDDWDRWNDRRDEALFSRADSSDSVRYVPVAIPGVYDLDNYGEWIETEEYGRMWSPRGVAADWAPYRDGYWRWFPTYGWTWISYEPWGWTPYHYGRWAYVRNRWCWAPVVNVNVIDVRPVTVWRWRPHHVVFFGWGGSYNRGYRDGYYDGYWKGFRDGRYGWLGWCPLGPRDRRDGPGDDARRIEALGNFHAPGGVSGMDARRFTGARVSVSREALNAPPLTRAMMAERHRSDGDSRRDFAPPALVRNEDLKPFEPMAATRSEAVARGRFARRIEAPVVFRRDRSGRITAPPIGRGDIPNPPASPRVPNERIERPSRMPDYKRPERVAAPPPRSRETEHAPSERAIERRKENDNSPRDESPSRDERRFDDASRRHDSPEWRRGERREEARQPDERRETRRDDRPSHDDPPRETRRAATWPRSDDALRRHDPPEWRRDERREERHDPTPHRETRRDDPPRDNPSHRETRRNDPPRDNSPWRSVERPSSPPPQSAPPRALERPQSPPPASPPAARENAPPRPSGGSSNHPTPRKPNVQ